MEQEGVRINKYLSDAGVCSRREADKLIEEGVVTVNGEVATLGTRVMPGQKVRVRGKEANLTKKDDKVVLAFHKPRGVECTSDRSNPDNIIDYINYGKRIYTVGRLDKNSSGLILLTNDGDLANRILENTELPFTWTSLAESAKCKAFTRSRIDRALCHALLHITAQDAELFKKGDALPYLRVLGVRKDSGDLLSSLCKTSKTPLLLRLFDDTKVLSEDAKHLLSLDLRASALYSQILYRKTGTVRNDGRRRLLTV